MNKKRVIILGAAGRDFHDFNTFFRNNPHYKVICFTAAQIPNISNRKYPKQLSGRKYPNGIPIYPEKDLAKLIKKYKIDQVIFSYSDVTHNHVMHLASIALANGAEFKLLSPKQTMLKSKKPVIAVTATRTGAGKSQTSRKIVELLKEKGKKVATIRHPMPYGDLKKQICQKFTCYKDLIKQNCTIEEIEEYEPYIERGLTVYSGVDYEKILRLAEKENDIILWDGGNNDLPFIKPNLHIVVADPLRPGDELRYHPGETNLRMADVVIINKIDSATKKNIQIVEDNIKKVNPKAKIIKAKSPIKISSKVRNKIVLIIEDGPTLTHGGMNYGAGYIGAKKLNCKIIDPRKYAVGSIKQVYKKYPNLKKIIPALGYSKKQLKELEQTINKAKCQAVIIGTPIDLSRYIKINKPTYRVSYSLDEKPKLKNIIKVF